MKCHLRSTVIIITGVHVGLLKQLLRTNMKIMDFPNECAKSKH